MQNIRKFIAAILLTSSGFSAAAAKEFQPHIIIAEPEFFSDDSYDRPDTVPVKMMTKPAGTFKPAQITSTQLQLQPVTTLQPKPKQTVTPAKVFIRDTALIKRLYEGFKPKTKVTAGEKTKIIEIIDSVVSKEVPATGNPELDYQAMVRIIDSLLKANARRDSEKVITDSLLAQKTDTAIVDKKKRKNGNGNFLQNYWWLITAILAISALAFFIMKRRRGSAADPKIFFSYAWDQDEALIMQLYSSLKKDGFNVIKDKENIGYKGVISKFMNEIGNADFVIVAISDKYLKSKFCMYELYEIFRNSGMNRDEFGKKIFPIRIEEMLNLSDPDVVNGYIRYWKEQEQEWTKRVKEESDSITEEQARQYQFIKRLVIDIRNILSCLADINSLNLSTLKSNDFADIKSALEESIEVKHK
jgi:hypothetical protein